MTVEEKRKKLSEFCELHSCTACILRMPVCRCGCDTTFLKKIDNRYEMSDGEIEAAYAVVFPKKTESDNP